jgi:dTDP-4-amino-4,6-dideoxygalactose transaminase
MFKKFQPIAASLAPNYTLQDVLIASKYLFLPWNWSKLRKGKKPKKLEKKIRQCLDCEMSPKNLRQLADHSGQAPQNRYAHAGQAISFDSGRSGLYTILKCLGIKKDDEVILQAFTTVALPNVIMWHGAKPVFIDIEKHTYNIDPKKIEEKITNKTKVVIVQHTFGNPARMDEIMEIAKKHDLYLIEDCAHCLGVEYKDKKMGTFGDAAFFSFGRDKVISSVAGGMVATNNKELGEKIREERDKMPYPNKLLIIRQLLQPIITYKALHTYYFFNIGKIIMYLSGKLNIITKAYLQDEKNNKRPLNFPAKMPNALATIALHQLELVNKFNDHRITVAKLYQEKLEEDQTINLPESDPEAKNIYLWYTILVKNKKEFIKKAKKDHIILGDWFPQVVGPAEVDLDKSGYKKGSCPVAEEVSSKCVNLPTHYRIGVREVEKIAKLIKSNNTL